MTESAVERLKRFSVAKRATAEGIAAAICGGLRHPIPPDDDDFDDRMHERVQEICYWLHIADALDALLAERERLVGLWDDGRAQYRVVWRLVHDLDLDDRGGCPDSRIVDYVNDVRDLRARAEARIEAALVALPRGIEFYEQAYEDPATPADVRIDARQALVTAAREAVQALTGEKP